MDTPVRLTSNRDKTLRGYVLSIDTRGHDEARPLVAWTAPDVLRVTVPNISHLSMMTRAFQGVKIDLRFDPDDPAARAAWLRKYDLRPDTDLEQEW